MARILLTDPLLKSLTETQPDRQKDYWDSVVQNLSARHNISGKIVFTVLTRLPGAAHPTRRTLGTYAPPLKLKKTKAEEAAEQQAAEGAESRRRIASTPNPTLTLAEARVAAREALAHMEKGVDPTIVRKTRFAEDRTKAIAKQKATLRVGVERYLEDKVLGGRKPQRRGEDVANSLRKQLVNFWLDESRRLGDVPVADVDDELIMRAVNYVSRQGGRDGAGAPTAAAKLLGRTKTLFKYLVHTSEFGIKTSPISEKNPHAVAEPVERDRVMEPYELRWFWKATERLKSPFREYYRLLLWTGQRRQQVAAMSTIELKRAADLPRVDDKEVIPANTMVWVLQPWRMKEDHWHYVPLPAVVSQVIDELPRLPEGPFLFSGTHGLRPISGFSKSKQRLDEAMLAVAREEAVAEGKDPAHVSVAPWRANDLRRTFRTMIGELDVPDSLCELLIAHLPPTVHRTYNRGKFLRQRLEAMELWAEALRQIVEPPPRGDASNVVTLKRQRQ